jgi:hypothetical protein
VSYKIRDAAERLKDVSGHDPQGEILQTYVPGSDLYTVAATLFALADEAAGIEAEQAAATKVLGEKCDGLEAALLSARETMDRAATAGFPEPSS